jgi:hypothetical protein
MFNEIAVAEHGFVETTSYDPKTGMVQFGRGAVESPGLKAPRLLGPPVKAPSPAAVTTNKVAGVFDKLPSWAPLVALSIGAYLLLGKK